MKKNKPYRSEAAAAIHETVAGLFDAGHIDKQTMRDFDETCFTRASREALTYVRATDTPAIDTPATGNKDSEAHPVG